MSQVLKRIFELSESRKIQKKKKKEYNLKRNNAYKLQKPNKEHFQIYNERLKHQNKNL